MGRILLLLSLVIAQPTLLAGHQRSGFERAADAAPYAFSADARLHAALSTVDEGEPGRAADAAQPESDLGRFLYNVALGVAVTVISALLLRAIL